MQLLLVQPPQGTQFGLARILTGEPLGLECVGGSVRARGYDAEIVDLRIDSWEALERSLRAPPAAVGVSCSFSTDVYATLEIARFVRKRIPEVPVVVGGHHASLLPGDFLFAGSHIDAVAIGQGEGTMADLMDALHRGTPLGNIPGLLTRSNRAGAFRRRPLARTIDDWPPADRQLTARYRARYHHGFETGTASIETSRGCPFDCNFCSVWVFYNRCALRRSPASIVRELERLSEEYVFITDDLSFLDYGVYDELANRLLACGMRKCFSAETRSDLVVQHRNLLPRWRRVGMDTIFLGIEKIDDAGLNAVRKRVRGGAGTNTEAIRILQGEGITPMTMFITDPDWGEREFDSLEEYVSRLGLPNPGFTVLTPLPGTDLYEARKGELVTHDYAYFDVIHAVLPTKLPLRRFYERLAGLYAYAISETRPTLTMLGRAIKLSLGGSFWAMRKVYAAVKELRDPASYLAPPARVHAPP